MSISVVIPVYNGGPDLDKTVPAVLALIGVDEIVWIDDGSEDRTSQRVLQHIHTDSRARLVSLPRNTGRGAARNRGLAETDGEVAVFLDADVVPPPKAAEVLRTTIGDGVAAVGRLRSVLQHPADPYQVYLARGRRGPPMDRVGGPIPWRFFLSGFCAVRRSALEAVGGFDASVPYGEDFALACALSQSDPAGLRFADVEADLFGVGGIDQALANARAFGASLASLTHECPNALALAGIEGTIQSPLLRRLTRRPAPPMVTSLIRRLPRSAQARAVRYLLGHALLVGLHGARDSTP